VRTVTLLVNGRKVTCILLALKAERSPVSVRARAQAEHADSAAIEAEGRGIRVAGCSTQASEPRVAKIAPTREQNQTLPCREHLIVESRLFELEFAMFQSAKFPFPFNIWN